MITWRKVKDSHTWMKGDNGRKGNEFRAYQIIYRQNGWIFDGTPKDEPWELYSYGGGKRSLTTTHQSRYEAMQFAESGKLVDYEPQL